MKLRISTVGPIISTATIKIAPKLIFKLLRYWIPLLNPDQALAMNRIVTTTIIIA